MEMQPFLAVWGAVTGTIAVCYNGRQWFLDRPKLKVEGGISFVNTDRLRAMFELTVVNTGRRPVSVKRVAIVLRKDAVPLLPQAPAAQPEPKQQPTCIASELNLYGRNGKAPTEIPAEVGQETWQCQLRRGIPFETHKHKTDTLGKAYVELTSGKKIFCEFVVPDEQHWPQQIP